MCQYKNMEDDMDVVNIVGVDACYPCLPNRDHVKAFCLLCTIQTTIPLGSIKEHFSTKFQSDLDFPDLEADRSPHKLQDYERIHLILPIENSYQYTHIALKHNPRQNFSLLTVFKENKTMRDIYRKSI